MATNTIRSRWAALGAAVAVSLGAGGIGITQATTSSGERPIYVPIEPCRLADTRPAPTTVGPRATPLGAGETYKLSGWGSVGDCTLPTGTTGLSLNVTAVGATLPTFLTLFPGDASLPDASHLNPIPGAPPTPNAVNVDLDTSGEFNIYNLQGLVNVIIDVVGYYDDHHHDDRYYQKSEVDTALADQKGEIDTDLDGKLDAPDRLPAHAIEFDPLTSGTTWTKGPFVQTHTATGSVECTAVHVDAPVGSTIASMSARYVAPNAGTEITNVVLVWKTEATVSSPLADIAVTVLSDAQTVAQTAGSAIDVLTSTPTTPYLVQPGDRVLMAVCTMDDLTLWSATLSLS